MLNTPSGISAAGKFTEENKSMAGFYEETEINQMNIIQTPLLCFQNVEQVIKVSGFSF
jgi:hypothetical protein